MTNLFHHFEANLPSTPEGVFLEGSNGTTSFEALMEASARFANALRQSGVSPGDRVLVQVEKSPSVVPLYLGCLRAGAIYVPLNTAYTSAELGYFIEDAEPSLLVVEPERLGALAHGNVATLTGREGLADRSAGESASFDTYAATDDDVAAILYTSGTTGRSKGAMLTHSNLSSNAFTLLNAWGWQRERDVLIHALPIYHVHGLFVATHCALLGGSRMIFQERFAVDDVLDVLQRATVFMGVPTYYTRLLRDPRFTRERCRNMRLFISGSAPLRDETFGEFEERTGQRILERYGMTEAGMITSNPIDGPRVAGAVGRPLEGVAARVRLADGTLAPAGEPGVLEIKGPNVFRGYWRMDSQTAEAFTPDGWFVTGDIATLDGDGVVRIVGRDKDMIISGGLNVYPKEVELLIDELPGVDESAVIGIPHGDWGEAVVAVVKAHPGEAPPEQRIVDALRDRLAGFKLPKRVVFVEELPRNAMGKVQKNVLRERYARTFDGA
jgi:malonyl-CoA/methylmalonyl-CoA synthetase